MDGYGFLHIHSRDATVVDGEHVRRTRKLMRDTREIAWVVSCCVCGGSFFYQKEGMMISLIDGIYCPVLDTEVERMAEYIALFQYSPVLDMLGLSVYDSPAII